MTSSPVPVSVPDMTVDELIEHLLLHRSLGLGAQPARVRVLGTSGSRKVSFVAGYPDGTVCLMAGSS
jgi:hypothetical protein